MLQTFVLKSAKYLCFSYLRKLTNISANVCVCYLPKL